MSRQVRVRGGAWCAAVYALLAVAAPAAAQGNGNGHGYGLSKKNASSNTPSAPAAGGQDISVPGTGVRNFGSWLDDASVTAPGSGYVSLAFSLWRSGTFREIDVPVIDSGLGLHPRVQFGVSAPFYHAGEPGSPMARGLGDVQFSTKIQLREPANRRVGFAATPMLEVLSAPLVEGGGRLHWALPLSLEVQRKHWRVFGSSGYFSRGAIFASAALEVPVSQRAWVTGSVSQSHSLKSDQLSFVLGLSKNRTDVSGSLAMTVHPRAAAFASVGRTVSRHDANSASLLFSTGVSFSFVTR